MAPAGAVAAAVALVAVGAAGSAATAALTGTVTLKPVDVTKACTFGGASAAKSLALGCKQSGAFAGSGGMARASYDWAWKLAVDANNATTGYGTESGTLVLDFGKRGLVRLALTGKQAPVGEATATSAREQTKGTWTMASGTGSYQGKRGRGTYTFTATRSGSATTFGLAKLALRGTVG